MAKKIIQFFFSGGGARRVAAGPGGTPQIVFQFNDANHSVTLGVF